MKFRILGDLEVRNRNHRLELGGSRQRIILATLLLNASQVVSMDRLLEAAYGADPPPTARSQAQIGISALRRALSDGDHAEVILTRPQGYVIELSADRLDALQFRQLIGRARKARADGRPGEAVAGYRDGLRLWRGPALDGIDSLLVQTAAGRLDEERITASEDVTDLELELGRHRELVGELAELVAEHPLRERLRGQLMLALHRCGRTADALEAYRAARSVLIKDLGIEPGDELKRLHEAILRSDPGLLPEPAEPVTLRSARPNVAGMLPTDIADFTARREEIREIRDCLDDPSRDSPQPAVPVAVITGKGGIGKTSIAVHVSHLLAERFPDGQLFADLHGATPRPARPEHVLERFLRALGMQGSQIPEGLEERAETYRARLAGRKMLVVLDDAAAEGDVTPLLPGDGAAAVIVTSRTRLAALAGAAHVDVGVLTADDSQRLLARIVGDERVQAEPRAAAEVAALCGHLPLALRIAGARLSARPHWDIQHLVDRLADETRRLDELRHGDMGIRANISLSYEAASEPAKRLFRLLALLDVPVFSSWTAAPLLDRPLPEAEDLLDELVNARLVESSVPGRRRQAQYHFHDLVRVFARERLAAAEPAQERKAALRRVLGTLLALAEEAHSLHYGGGYFRLGDETEPWPIPPEVASRLASDPLRWLERERPALVSAVRQAGQAGFTDLCWKLAFTSVTLFESRIYLDDWRETHQCALAAARGAGDLRGQAAMLYSAGSLSMTEKQFDAARRDLNEGARLFRQVGDVRGVALVTRHIASLDRLNGNLDDASTGYQRSLAFFEELPDPVAAAYVLHNMAQLELDRRRPQAAQRLLARALELSGDAGSDRVQAQVLHRIGEAHLLAEEPRDAVRAFERALAKVRGTGDAIGQAYVLQGLGTARLRLGDFGDAGEALRTARSLALTAGEPLAEAGSLLGLGELALRRDDPGRAAALGREASDIFRDLGAPLLEDRARALVTDATAVTGSSPPAFPAQRPAPGRAPREAAPIPPPPGT